MTRMESACAHHAGLALAALLALDDVGAPTCRPGDTLTIDAERICGWCLGKQEDS